MTDEEIIDMAMLKAEFVSHGKPSEEESELFVCTDKDIVRFARLVAEKEREACAKVCEDIALGFTKWPESYRGLTAETKLMRSMGEFVHKPFVDAIRARGQE